MDALAWNVGLDKKPSVTDKKEKKKQKKNKKKRSRKKRQPGRPRYEFPSWASGRRVSFRFCFVFWLLILFQRDPLGTRAGVFRVEAEVRQLFFFFGFLLFFFASASFWCVCLSSSSSSSSSLSSSFSCSLVPTSRRLIWWSSSCYYRVLLGFLGALCCCCRERKKTWWNLLFFVVFFGVVLCFVLFCCIDGSIFDRWWSTSGVFFFSLIGSNPNLFSVDFHSMAISFASLIQSFLFFLYIFCGYSASGIGDSIRVIFVGRDIQVVANGHEQQQQKKTPVTQNAVRKPRREGCGFVFILFWKQKKNEAKGEPWKRWSDIREEGERYAGVFFIVCFFFLKKCRPLWRVRPGATVKTRSTQSKIKELTRRSDRCGFTGFSLAFVGFVGFRLV